LLGFGKFFGMTEDQMCKDFDGGDQPGKTRTWWHPLLARLLDHVLATAYSVFEEVLVGKMPLRVDILLIRREEGQLSEAGRRDLASLLSLLNRFTLIEFKGPTDALEPGDLAQLVGCSFLWHSQQGEGISRRDVSLIVVAPCINEALRSDLRLLECDASEHERGIFRIMGLPFATWLVETDVMADLGQPILSLVSRVFLDEHKRIIQELKKSGHAHLLCYALQQIQQFRRFGEDFAMQHKDSEYLGELEDELKIAVLEAIPAEERLEGLSAEERLEGLSAEEVVGGLSEKELARLRELLERKQGN